jgi:hypothetical protein
VRTCLSLEFAPSYVEKPQFSAGVWAGASGAVGRDARDVATSGRRAVISLSGDIPVPRRPWEWVTEDVVWVELATLCAGADIASKRLLLDSDALRPLPPEHAMGS